MDIELSTFHHNPYVAILPTLLLFAKSAGREEKLVAKFPDVDNILARQAFLIFY